MKTGKSVRLPACACLSCGAVSDAASVVDDEGTVRPTPGSITVCISCGHWMAFDDTMQFRELTDEEIIDLAGDKRLLAISRAIHQMQEKKKTK